MATKSIILLADGDTWMELDENAKEKSLIIVMSEETFRELADGYISPSEAQEKSLFTYPIRNPHLSRIGMA